MCFAPETQVLTRELTWKPIASLDVGDALWAFDPEPVVSFSKKGGLIGRPLNRARRTKLAVIESIHCATRPACLLTTESGRSLVVCRQQNFLGYSGGFGLRWRSAKSLARPYNGHSVAALASWLNPWQPLEDFDAGWLSGMFDGEGHVSVRQGSTRSLVLGLTQREGLVLERAREILVGAGFSLGGSSARGTNGNVTNLRIVCGLAEKMRALGIFRPIRLMDKLLRSECSFEVWLKPEPVSRIEAIGEADLMEVRTSTGTFFAEGFAARCCET